jgi:hypothetical protein
VTNTFPPDVPPLTVPPAVSHPPTLGPGGEDPVEPADSGTLDRAKVMVLRQR